jgi:outer membrane receptor protein involved in Fe transport
MHRPAFDYGVAMKPLCYLACTAILIAAGACSAQASVFGDVKGTVLDPQQRPISAAKVNMMGRASAYTRTTVTDNKGEFLFRSVPIGEYIMTVEVSGFGKSTAAVTVLSDRTTSVAAQLQIAPVAQQVTVNMASDSLEAGAQTPVTLVNRREIEVAPGADRTNSLAMITNFVPGAYIAHNQLHIRGGHQVTWLVDGVPVANTNIADTVGPQFDPKDVDYLEVERGSYTAEYGDRTYAMFNVVPRNGFERKREAELLMSYGNFNQTNEHFSFASHTKRFAYYASINGNRSDYGLETPVREVIHDHSNGLGGFASLIFNPNTKDQFRVVSAVRRDFFQVPNDPDAQESGTRDVERERDGFMNFSWIRTLNSTSVLTVSPFYHYNRAALVGGPNDSPVSTSDDRSSHYGGAQVVLSALTDKHNAKIGFYGFLQRDSTSFALSGADDLGKPIDLIQVQKQRGRLTSFFGEDQFKPAAWLSLTGGFRFTHFHGPLIEDALDPRAGLSLRLPRLPLVFHGFYGRYYQAPPLSTVSGPLLQFALAAGFDFIPLRGERDEEYRAGATLPFRGWTIDAGYLHTRAKNYFDHDALGNSNIFLPLTIERVFIRAIELTAQSAEIFHCAHFHLAYSRQVVQGQGGVTGGLTDFSPPSEIFFLDHDQRHTLSSGVTIDLPRRSYVAANVNYGSGFLDGDGPQHLPGHATLDVSLGKRFGEDWLIALQTVNVTNNRYLLDNSNTFGGTHFAEPRQIYFELKYRFHY